MDEKTFVTGLGTIHYWTGPVEAARPWLIFLPGLTADSRLFERQMEGLGARCNCLVWDAPAHGKSRPFPLDFSLEDMADYLRGILDAEGISRPILVGQSLGGYVSQVFMTRYPGTASGFVSIDSKMHFAGVLHRGGAVVTQAHRGDVPVHSMGAAEAMGPPGHGGVGLRPQGHGGDDGGLHPGRVLRPDRPRLPHSGPKH